MINYNAFTAFIESGAKEDLYRRFDEPVELTFYFECGEEDGFLLCFDIYPTFSMENGLSMYTRKFTPAQFADFMEENND